MIRIDHASAKRRPSLSPKAPQMIPPIGRSTNEIANTAYVINSSIVLSVDGKNTVPITTAKYP